MSRLAAFVCSSIALLASVSEAVHTEHDAALLGLLHYNFAEASRDFLFEVDIPEESSQFGSKVSDILSINTLSLLPLDIVRFQGIKEKSDPYVLSVRDAMLESGFYKYVEFDGTVQIPENEGDLVIQ